MSGPLHHPQNHQNSFGYFDDTHFPRIEVTLSHLRDMDSFQQFLDHWDYFNDTSSRLHPISASPPTFTFTSTSTPTSTSTSTSLTPTSSQPTNPPRLPPLAYYYIFHTSGVSGASIKYCVRMSNFIKYLKKRQKKGTQHLQASIIIVNRAYVRFFLKIIFLLQRPVADVYLVPDITTANNIYSLLINQQTPTLDYLSAQQSSLVTREIIEPDSDPSP